MLRNLSAAKRVINGTIVKMSSADIPMVLMCRIIFFASTFFSSF